MVRCLRDQVQVGTLSASFSMEQEDGLVRGHPYGQPRVQSAPLPKHAARCWGRQVADRRGAILLGRRNLRHLTLFTSSFLLFCFGFKVAMSGCTAALQRHNRLIGLRHCTAHTLEAQQIGWRGTPTTCPGQRCGVCERLACVCVWVWEVGRD